MLQEDVTQLFRQHPPSLLFRRKAMPAVEDDCPLACDSADRPSNTIDEDTFHDRDIGTLDNGLNVDRRSLAGKRDEAARTIAG